MLTSQNWEPSQHNCQQCGWSRSKWNRKFPQQLPKTSQILHWWPSFAKHSKRTLRVLWNRWRRFVRDNFLKNYWLNEWPPNCSFTCSTCINECHLRNFKSGTCNADDSRCLCSEDRISAFEYGMCSSLGVCNVYCQSKTYVRGECSGFGGWTCHCVGKDANGTEGKPQSLH